MIERAVLVRVDRRATQGRTGPIIAACEDEQGVESEVILKLSAGCDQQVVNLAREAISACLAHDLGLPVPRPWLVEIPPAIVTIVADQAIAEKLRTSSPMAFGSTRSSGFSAWSAGQRLTASMRPVAAGILLFDAIIQNSDRRADNPNCLVRGEELRIIDHDLAFTHGLILGGWTAPWSMGGMRSLRAPGHHIFVQELAGQSVDLRPIRDAWNNLSDGRLQEYAAAVPPEWIAARGDVDAALQLIADARDNIDGCIEELGRLLA